jgi:DNA-binding NarL/FixJ family response regulator
MYSILIIEDDSVYLSVIETFLTLEGFDVRTAPEGRSGLAALREKRPDLVLCDIMMPVMDGYEVMESLKLDDEFADTPFIFMSALGDRDDVRRGMSGGADDYLTKPFSTDELLAAVIGRLRRHIVIKQHDKSAFKKELAILHEKITARELEVLRIVGQGVTSKEIARRLGVSLRTVEAHRTSLMNKLDAVNAASLARWAVIAEQCEE